MVNTWHSAVKALLNRGHPEGLRLAKRLHFVADLATQLSAVESRGRDRATLPAAAAALRWPLGRVGTRLR